MEAVDSNASQKTTILIRFYVNSMCDNRVMVNIPIIMEKSLVTNRKLNGDSDFKASTR